jgi:hypothetical protein
MMASSGDLLFVEQARRSSLTVCAALDATARVAIAIAMDTHLPALIRVAPQAPPV